MNIRISSKIVGAVAALACCVSSSSILGVEYPNINIVEESRKAGMPYLHPSTKMLQGKYTKLSSHIKDRLQR